MFPSWLRHQVPANDGQTERISIAVNLMFEQFAETMASPMWTPTTVTRPEPFIPLAKVGAGAAPHAPLQTSLSLTR
jgi:hypothetical protein